MWGPGLVAKEAAGTRNRQSAFAAIDLTPTLLTIAQVDVPQNANFDGEPLADTLLGRSTQSRRAPLFFSRPPDRKSFYGLNNLPDLAMRHGDWKLLCDCDGSRPELYDLARDQGEKRNLESEQPQVVENMTKQVTDWFAQMPDEVVKALQ